MHVETNSTLLRPQGVDAGHPGPAEPCMPRVLQRRAVITTWDIPLKHVAQRATEMYPRFCNFLKVCVRWELVGARAVAKAQTPPRKATVTLCGVCAVTVQWPYSIPTVDAQ